jgi:hypothetical protein
MCGKKVLVGLLVFSFICSGLFAARFVPIKTPREATEASVEVTSTSLPESVALPVAAEPSENSSELMPTMTLDESMNRLTTSKAVKKAEPDALEVVKAEIARLQQDMDNYDNELTLRDKEIDRLHLGLGIGATVALFPENTFGVSILGTLRKNSIILLAGVEYPDVVNIVDFDYKKLSYKCGMIYEF